MRVLALCLLVPWARSQDCGESCDHEDSSLLALRPVRLSQPEDPCQGKRGVRWSLDGVEGSADDFNGWRPLTVPDGGRLVIYVCSVKAEDEAAPIVESVGKKANVRVAVVDSFNMLLTEDLEFKGTLLPPVVKGDVGAGTVVKVALNSSGNVRLAGGAMLLLQGSLVAAAVEAPSLDGSKVSVFADSCGSVSGDGLLNVSHGGALLRPLLRAGAVSTATVRVKVEEAASAVVRALNVTAAQLVESCVDIESAVDSDIYVEVNGAAMFKGDLLALHNSFLATGAFNATGSMNGTQLKVEVKELAVVKVQNALVLGSLLLNEGVGLPHVVGGSVDLELEESVLVEARQLLLLGDRSGPRSGLMGVAMAASGTFHDDAKVRLNMRAVAAMDVAFTLMSYAHLMKDAVLNDGPVKKGVMEVRLRGVGVVKGERLEMLENANFAWDIVDDRQWGFMEDSNFSLAVEESFNVRMERDLLLNGSSCLICDGVDYKFQRCNVSVDVVDSFNFEVDGNMLMRASIIDDFQDGPVHNSSYRISVLRSASLLVKGNLTMSNYVELFRQLQDGDIRDSSHHATVLDSINVHVGGDFSMKEYSSLANNFYYCDISNASLSLTVQRSMSARAQGSALLTGSSELISGLIYDASDASEVRVRLSSAAKIAARHVVLEGRSSLVTSLLRGRGQRNTSLSFSAKDVANVEGEALLLNKSFLMTAALDDELEGCSVELALGDTANAHAGSVTIDGALLRSAVVSDEILNSNVSVTASHVACVAAKSVDMSGAAVEAAFVSDDAASSKLAVAWERVGNVEAKRAVLRSAKLIAALLQPPQQNVTMEAWLRGCAGLQVQNGGELVDSSLLGEVLGAVELSLSRTALLCEGEGMEGRALVTAKNSSLCADGAARLEEAAKRFRQSCKARSCRLVEQ